MTHVLDHELAHRLFEKLSETDKTSFRRAGKWILDEKKGFLPGRKQSEFVHDDDRLSPVEDFADTLTAFIHRPAALKTTAPAIYDWMKKHFGAKMSDGIVR